jgi:hypothetical protein
MVTANVDPSSLLLFTLIMEAMLSSETSVLTRATRRHIPEDGILQCKFWGFRGGDYEEWRLLECYGVWLL